MGSIYVLVGHNNASGRLCEGRVNYRVQRVRLR